MLWESGPRARIFSFISGISSVCRECRYIQAPAGTQKARRPSITAKAEPTQLTAFGQHWWSVYWPFVQLIAPQLPMQLDKNPMKADIRQAVPKPCSKCMATIFRKYPIDAGCGCDPYLARVAGTEDSVRKADRRTRAFLRQQCFLIYTCHVQQLAKH